MLRKIQAWLRSLFRRSRPATPDVSSAETSWAPPNSSSHVEVSMRSAGRVVRIRRIRLENVCGFRSVDLSLRQTAVVIGRNSTNKTTLLRAIALGLADSRSATALLAQPVGRFVRSGADRALIEMEVETEH